MGSADRPEQASISTDSHLRVHQSLDPALDDWSLAHDIHVPTFASDGSAQAVEGVEAGSTGELANGGWGLSWCRERWWGSVLATFAGMSPVAKVSFNDHRSLLISLQ